MPLPTPRKPDRPTFWIIAGPNGSGKSSLYNRTDFQDWGGSIWIINPDLLTQTIAEREEDAENPNLASVQRIEQWLDASIEVYQTIGVETVLSSGKYRRLVEKAHRYGFTVKMMYVLLRSPELQIERVRLRVAEGGHDVPEDRIRSRRTRSFGQLAWFYRYVDECYVYDNSTGDPELIAEKLEGHFVSWSALPYDLHEALEAEGVYPVPVAQK